MKTKGKAWQLVVTALLIVVFVYTAFFGVAAKYGDVTTTYIKGAKDIRSAPERPQTLRLCSIKNILSAIYAQSNAERI